MNAFSHDPYFISLDERIVDLLMTDGRFGAMTGIHHHIIRKRIQFFFYAFHQDIIVPGGKVCPSYAFPEKDITGNDKSLILLVQTNASISMSRSIKHFQYRISEFYKIAVLKVSFYCRDPVNCVSIHLCNLLHGEEKSIAGLMIFRVNFIPGCNKIMTQHMIDMTMRIDIPCKLQFVNVDKLTYLDRKSVV